MATIGQTLATPEAGWQRIEDTDVNFTYIGSWKTDSSPNYVGGSHHGATAGPASVKFNFTGSEIRIISAKDTNRISNVTITIDGVAENFSQYSDQTILYALCYEKTGLDNKEHSVVISSLDNLTETKFLDFDAIDISDTGELKPYPPISVPINLTATAGDTKVSLSWTAITGATGYNVKRSATAGGPYETIATNVSGTSYIDNSVVNGTTYYYVVTAVTAEGESANSNEASATPNAAPVENKQALLRITMSDSSEREYKVSVTVVNDFMNWCNRTIGTGSTFYSFDKSTQNSKEYLFYEKIISFEVIPIA